MPFALGIIGLLLIISGARGTYPQLKDLLIADFTGKGNFWYWIIAIGVSGSIGYAPGLEKFSRSFLALVILAMVLANKGFFAKFSEALASLQGGSSSSASTPDAAKDPLAGVPDIRNVPTGGMPSLPEIGGSIVKSILSRISPF